jgi:hypothetical protein
VECAGDRRRFQQRVRTYHESKSSVVIPAPRLSGEELEKMISRNPVPSNVFQAARIFKYGLKTWIPRVRENDDAMSPVTENLQLVKSDLTGCR